MLLRETEQIPTDALVVLQLEGKTLNTWARQLVESRQAEGGRGYGEDQEVEAPTLTDQAN